MIGKLDELKTNMVSKMKTKGNIYEDLNTLEKLLLESMNVTVSVDRKEKVPKSNQKKAKGKAQWYNRECVFLKRKLDYLCKRVSKMPQNAELRRSFYQARKQYRNLTKSLKNDFEKRNIDKMECSAII